MSLILPDLLDLLDLAGREAEVLVAELQDGGGARACAATAGSTARRSTPSSTPPTASPGRRPMPRPCARPPPGPRALAADGAVRRGRGPAGPAPGARISEPARRRPADEPGRDVPARRPGRLGRTAWRRSIAGLAPGASQAVKARIVELLDQAPRPRRRWRPAASTRPWRRSATSSPPSPRRRSPPSPTAGTCATS